MEYLSVVRVIYLVINYLFIEKLKRKINIIILFKYDFKVIENFCLHIFFFLTAGMCEEQ